MGLRVFTLVILAGLCLDVRAQQGQLDPEFALGGGVRLGIGNGDSYLRGLGIQSDGSIIVAGTEIDGGKGIIGRLTPDGSWDPTFGSSGLGYDLIDACPFPFFEELVVQSDDKIVVAGHCRDGTFDISSTYTLLVRFTASGQLDPAFGAGGIVTWDGWTTQEDAYLAVALDSQERIVVAGRLNTSSGYYPILRMISSSGNQIGSTFVSRPCGGNFYYRAIAVQSDDRVVGTGRCDFSSGDQMAWAARYAFDGTEFAYDTSFSGDGTAIMGGLAAGSDSEHYDDILVQSDGKIVAAGQAVVGGTRRASAFRLNPDGSLDTGFSGDGFISQSWEEEAWAWSAESLPDNRLALGGWRTYQSNTDWAILVYDSSGALDAEFGNAGGVTLDWAGSTDTARNLAVHNGALLAVGEAWDPADGRYEVAVARYFLDTCSAYSSGRVYVDGSATGTGVGSGWTNAHSDLASALDAANQCSDVNEVWVADGTYKPTTGSDRAASFTVARDYSVYGGFAGSETSAGQRDPVTNVVTLSGDIGSANDDSDNSYNVLTIDGTASPITSAVIEGLTITGGNANGGSFTRRIGGAILCNGIGAGSVCSPRLDKLIVESNTGNHGAIAIAAGDDVGTPGGTASPTMSGLRIANNSVSSNGPAMYVNTGQGTVHMTITDSDILDNTSGSSGGGISFNSVGDMQVTMIDVRLEGNTNTRSNGVGGAIFWQGASSDTLDIVNAVIAGNSAYRGAAVYSQSGTVTLTNATIVNNTVSGSGALYFESGFLDLRNTVAWSNLNTSGASSEADGNGSWDRDYTLIEGFTSTAGNRISSAGLKAADVFTAFASGDYTPAVGGVLVDAGDSAAPGLAGVLGDLVGVSRVQGSAVDVGAFESSPPASIVVTSPNGGETWAMGSTQTITWSSTDYSGTVEIDLVDAGGSLVELIDSGVADTGSYDWSNITVVDGPGDYRIRVMTSDGAATDVSDADFTIEFAPAVAAVPQQETLLPGDVLTLQFDASNVVDLFGLSFQVLYDASRFSYVESSIAPGSFLAEGDNPITFAEDQTGVLSVSFSRTGSSGVTGSGVIGEVQLQVVATSPTLGTAAFEIDAAEFEAVDPNGASLTVSRAGGETTIGGVWPGDTDNNCVVGADDLLPIGLNFDATGPSRSSGDINWGARAYSSWSARLLAFSDATGDGEVDHRDVLPIGLNYANTRAESTGCTAEAANKAPLNSIALGPLAKDETVEIALTLGGVSDVVGLAASVMLPAEISVLSITPHRDLRGSDVLSLVESEERGVSFAFSQPGQADPVTLEGSAVTLRLVADQRLTSGRVVLVEAKVSSSAGIARAGQARIALSSPPNDLVEVPTEITLAQNYPNPFNPTSTITFTVPETGHVRLDVVDLLGRVVKVLHDGPAQQGRHPIRLDASGLPAGVYLYRMAMSGRTLTRQMVLLK